jgi:hypothetical protein
MNPLAPVPVFAWEDDFLHAALGLLAAREEVLGALERLEPAENASTSPRSGDATLYAVLGLLGLLERGGAVLESWAVAVPQPPALSEPRPPLESLLR